MNKSKSKNVKPSKVGITLEQIAEEDDDNDVAEVEVRETSIVEGEVEISSKTDEEDMESGDASARAKRDAAGPIPTACNTDEINLPLYVIDSSSKFGVMKRPIKGDVEFTNVSFSYPARPNQRILNNFNLKIKAGTTVALVGPSGGGKSTTVGLIERFYDVTSGSLTIDGINIKDYNVKNLRSQIGIVQQEPILFATTIRENIQFGGCNNNTTSKTNEDDAIELAAKSANAHEFISNFPDGYDTFVGDKGAQLSGGKYNTARDFI